MARPPEPEPEPFPTTALLWDLDKIAPGREHLTSFAQALCDLGEPDAARIAPAHRQALRSCRGVLADLQIQCFPVAAAPRR